MDPIFIKPSQESQSGRNLAYKIPALGGQEGHLLAGQEPQQILEWTLSIMEDTIRRGRRSLGQVEDEQHTGQPLAEDHIGVGGGQAREPDSHTLQIHHHVDSILPPTCQAPMGHKHSLLVL